MQARKVRIIITDYDLCAIAYNGTQVDMVSPALVAFVKRKPYEGFYGCTHRAYSNMSFVVGYASKHANKDAYSDEQVKQLSLTTTATNNITAKLGIKCLGVSTFEDTVKGRKCGQGYEEIIKPFEESNKKPEKSASFLRFLFCNLHDKKTQLTQIATDAVEKFPDATITFHYIDDNTKILKNALEVTQEKAWPKNAKIKFFHLDPKGDTATIQKFNLNP